MLNRELLYLLVAVHISLHLLDLFLGHWITETQWGKDPSWLQITLRFLVTSMSKILTEHTLPPAVYLTTHCFPSPSSDISTVINLWNNSKELIPDAHETLKSAGLECALQTSFWRAALLQRCHLLLICRNLQGKGPQLYNAPVPLFMGNKKHNEMISQCIDESFLFRYVLGFFLLSCPHPFPLNNHPLSTQKSLQS